MQKRGYCGCTVGVKPFMKSNLISWYSTAFPTFDIIKLGIVKLYPILRCMIICFCFFGKGLAPLCLVCWSLCLANVWSNRRQAHQTKGGLKFTCQNSLKMQLEHASSSFYSPQERALVRNTTASAILDQVQSLATFEAFGTFNTLYVMELSGTGFIGCPTLFGHFFAKFIPKC